MFSCRDALAATALAVLASSMLHAPSQAQESPQLKLPREIGRAATAQEIQAWNIDVRPDFQGLPQGRGTARVGQAIWEKQCAACHGVFGESGEFANPIVGGTTAEDIKNGRAARLADPSYPERTTLIQLTSVSTLWDYIHRAMPWNAPKSLSADEVYSVTAYLLFMGAVVAEDFVLSDASIAEAQARLPNRTGGTTDHSMWPGRTSARRAADTRNRACMKDCESRVENTSTVPASAANAHGNLADQTRLVGPLRGVQTGDHAEARSEMDADRNLPQRFACTTCHDTQRKIFGPAFHDIARKYAFDPDAVGYLTRKIRSGGNGVWGAAAMPPQDIDEAHARRIARWIVDGAQ